jgi:hypothetical protein
MKFLISHETGFYNIFQFQRIEISVTLEDGLYIGCYCGYFDCDDVCSDPIIFGVDDFLNKQEAYEILTEQLSKFLLIQ